MAVTPREQKGRGRRTQRYGRRGPRRKSTAKRPFAGPAQVLDYLARYTHRVAIGNSRLISASADVVRFRWKDYRQPGKSKVMSLATGEFIRRFLMHTLPDGFHRIRYYGFAANGHRSQKLVLCRNLLDIALPHAEITDVAQI